MPIDFHSEQNRKSYADRSVDPAWSDWILTLVDPHGKTVIDVGCGGGLYTRAWAEVGAGQVIGVDFSNSMLKTAQETCSGLSGVSFRHGDASQTGLPDGIADIVFQKALLHHVTDLRACLVEMHRLLRDGGVCLIQNRTPEDVKVSPSQEHIRGYFFEKFPHLLEIEMGRRPKREEVEMLLLDVGFKRVDVYPFWETNRVYDSVADLREDLLARKGRSLLHELSDDQLKELANYIEERLPAEGPIIDRSRWTIWAAWQM